MNAPITITNCGPIDRAVIPCPEPGKIIVLLGRNGTGKTTALEHVECAVTGRGKGNLRDGAKSGEVEALGVTMKLSRSTRRTGELIVESLDGKFNLSELIDANGIKDPKAADATRIKALIQISNVLPSVDLFYELLGGREALEKVVGSAALESKDLVQMAERIKRDLEAAARREEDQASHAEGRARGAKEAAAGVDVNAEHDATVLQARLREAIQAEAKLTADREAAEKARDAQQAARDQLQDAEAAYTGPSVAAARLVEAEATKLGSDAEAAVRGLEAKLSLAKQKLQLQYQAVANAIANRKAAESHEQSMQAWRQQLNAVLPVEPSPDEEAAAAARVRECNEACDRAAVIRRALEQLADAERHLQTGSAHRKRSLELRDAAKGTDDVLSNFVAKSAQQLRVEGGRLVLDTPTRGKTFFHELSAGEKARIAIDIGIDAMPPNKQGVIILSQEIWEGLDPRNREALRVHLSTRPVGMLTAEASDDVTITPVEFVGLT